MILMTYILECLQINMIVLQQYFLVCRFFLMLSPICCSKLALCSPIIVLSFSNQSTKLIPPESENRVAITFPADKTVLPALVAENLCVFIVWTVLWFRKCKGRQVSYAVMKRRKKSVRLQRKRAKRLRKTHTMQFLLWCDQPLHPSIFSFPITRCSTQYGGIFQSYMRQKPLLVNHLCWCD